MLCVIRLTNSDGNPHLVPAEMWLSGRIAVALPLASAILDNIFSPRKKL